MLKTHLSVQYLVSVPTEAKPLTHEQQQTEEMSQRLRHLSAMWGVLRLVDLNRPWYREATSQTLQELSDILGDFADLGSYITDGAFGALSELQNLQDK